MTALADRLRAALAHRHVSPAQLARMTKISRGGISMILTGKTKTLRSETALRIAGKLGIRVQWLVDGSGQMTDGALPRANWVAALTPDQSAMRDAVLIHAGLIPDEQARAITSLVLSCARPAPKKRTVEA